MKKGILSIIISISVFVLFFSTIYAQTKKINTKYNSMEDCLQKFDIDNIDFKNDSNAEKNISFLSSYSQCISCQDDSFYSKISFLPYVKQNKNDFIPYTMQYWIEMFKYQEITDKLLDLCVQNGELTREECRSNAQAFKAQDLSICEANNDCKAVILLDESMTSKESRKDFIRFAKAIRGSLIKDCENINDEAMKISCQAYINKDKTICQGLLGFNMFQEEYCKNCQEQGGENNER